MEFLLPHPNESRILRLALRHHPFLHSILRFIFRYATRSSSLFHKFSFEFILSHTLAHSAPSHIIYHILSGGAAKVSLVNNPLIVHKVMVAFNCVRMWCCWCACEKSHFSIPNFLPCIPFMHTEYVRARLTFDRQKLFYSGKWKGWERFDLNVKTILKWLCWVEHKLIFTNACQLYCPANGIHTVPFTVVRIHYLGILVSFYYYYMVFVAAVVVVVVFVFVFGQVSNGHNVKKFCYLIRRVCASLPFRTNIVSVCAPGMFSALHFATVAVVVIW